MNKLQAKLIIDNQEFDVTVEYMQISPISNPQCGASILNNHKEFENIMCKSYKKGEQCKSEQL